MLKTFSAVAVLLLGSLAHAQAPATAKKVIDGGVSPIRLLDRPEVRVIRTEIQPHTTRAVHTHDDVKFHMFIPITGSMQLDVDGAQSVTVTPWQPYVMKAGTKHGFHNSGSSPVEIMEVFVK